MNREQELDCIHFVEWVAFLVEEENGEHAKRWLSNVIRRAKKIRDKPEGEKE